MADNQSSAATEHDYLEDNIAAVAHHLGQPGAFLAVHYDGDAKLLVEPGEVLKEVSRRLTTETDPIRWIKDTYLMWLKGDLDPAHMRLGQNFFRAAVVPTPAQQARLPDEEPVGKEAVRLLSQWVEIASAEDQEPYQETMALLGKPNSAGWVWAKEVRFERDFDAEQERTRKVAMEAIMGAEARAELYANSVPAPPRCSAATGDVDQLALNIVNQIWATPEDWHPVRRKAHAQVLIIDALRRMTGEPQGLRVSEEALRNAGCPSDRRGTVGDCHDAGTCGCSLPLTRPEHS